MVTVLRIIVMMMIMMMINWYWGLMGIIMIMMMMVITQFCDRFPCFAPQDGATVSDHAAHMYNTCINGICNVQRSSWYTDGISHKFHKNGKTYQNTHSMSLSEMKQLLIWLLRKIVIITGMWISRSIFWEKHVRLQAHIVNSIHCTGIVQCSVFCFKCMCLWATQI